MTITAVAPVARQQELLANGTIASGAKLYTFSAGTTSPLATYNDADLTVLNTNPVLASASGLLPAVYFLPQAYKLRLTDANDLLLWEQDYVSDVGSTLAALTQIKFCTTTTSATTNTTLTNITGLTGFAVTAATVYQFQIDLSCTAGASGGIKVAFKYTTATLTNLESAAAGFTASAVAVQHVTSTTDQASLYAQTAAVLLVRITGRITVNAAGTIALQMAQNASDGTVSSVYAGSSMTLRQV